MLSPAHANCQGLPPLHQPAPQGSCELLSDEDSMGLFGTETWLQFLGGGRLPGCKISTEYEVLHSQGVSGKKRWQVIQVPFFLQLKSVRL